MKFNKNKIKPTVIGLGYVGLPVFLKLAKKFDVVGFDINTKRVKNLNNGFDENEIEKKKIKLRKNSFFTSNKKKITKCNFFIICVPTPIFKNKLPDLNYLRSASKLVGKCLKKNDIVIFESTVYPGVTNNFCKNILEKNSKLKSGKDFFICYSPERINPGDKIHQIDKIAKIVSIENRKIKNSVLSVYKNITKKIVFSNNIDEAETSKVIENIQRDLNIALVNEIFMVCKKLGVNFFNVMKLASTKWNFINYKPGLVGGHCLPVDPYYFSYIANKKNLKTNILLAGRKTNESMVQYVVKSVSKKIKKTNSKNKNILVCGITYKSNVPDIRNSLALKIFKKLKKKYKHIDCYDPIFNENLKSIKLKKKININKYNLIIFLVNHRKFKSMERKIKNKSKILDLFGFFVKR